MESTDSTPKQRLVGLTVGEISLVDLPAIEAEFTNIQKATWSGAMINDLPDSSFLHIESGGKKDADGKTVPRDLRMFPVKDGAGKVDLPHLRNALARIPQSNLPQDVKDKLTKEAQQMLAEAEKQQTTSKSQEGSMSTAATTGAAATTTTAAGGAAAAATTTGAAGAAAAAGDAKLDVVTKALETLAVEVGKATANKAEVPAAMKVELKKMAGEIAKLIGDETAATTAGGAAAASGGAAATTGAAAGGTTTETDVEKGKKQFSAERLKAMSDALSTLMGVMKDIDPAAAQGIVASLSAAATQAAPAALTAGAVSKAVEEAVAKALAPVATLTTTVEGVAKRIDAIEKAAAGSKGLNSDTTETPVAKGKKGLWSGVL